jgi:hypothetical protein
MSALVKVTSQNFYLKTKSELESGLRTAIELREEKYEATVKRLSDSYLNK